jgi:hypothetical protein
MVVDGGSVEQKQILVCMISGHRVMLNHSGSSALENDWS